MRNEAPIDVAVLILFFNRPGPLAQVFEQVRKARPSRLYLYQDGPRSEADLPGIEACREVVSHIDWDCHVERWYQTHNQGCDPSEYLSQKWAFSMSDKCIVLEDDDVPSVSFFQFCKELLDRYEHDERVGMISGFNYEEVTPHIDSDYFFTTTFSISGWASWRRVIDTWEEHYDYLNHPTAVKLLDDLIEKRKYKADFLATSRRHSAEGIPYYETIFQASQYLHNRLAIVPTRNMINNLGATPGSTNFSGSNSTLPRGYRRIFTMSRYEVPFPLRHPTYMIDNAAYQESMYRIMGWRHPFIKIGRSFEELYLNLRQGNYDKIQKSIANRINKWKQQLMGR